MFERLTIIRKKNIIKFVCCLSIAVILIGCQSVNYDSPIKSEELVLNNIENLNMHINTVIKNNDIEKMSVALINDNKIIYSHAINMREDEQLQAGSISKVFTAYASLKLVEDGKIEIDKPLTNYLKSEYFPPDSKGNLITLRMVLNHTCGLGNDISGKDRNVYFEPGKEFHYSGAGYKYLMEVIESITDMPFDEYMERNILKTLGMINSKFSIKKVNGKKFVSAAASLMTTPSDLAKFFMELMNPKMISKGVVKQMLAESVRIDSHYSWGLGIGLQHGKNETAIWHWGNNDNLYKSLVFIYPKQKIGIIILIKGKNGDKIYEELANFAIGGDYYGLDNSVLHIR